MAKEYQFEHETWEPPDKELRALRKDFYGPITQELLAKAAAGDAAEEEATRARQAQAKRLARERWRFMGKKGSQLGTAIHKMFDMSQEKWFVSWQTKEVERVEPDPLPSARRNNDSGGGAPGTNTSSAELQPVEAAAAAAAAAGSTTSSNGAVVNAATPSSSSTSQGAPKSVGLRLFCFPWEGASPSVFEALSWQIPNAQVVAVCYPGRAHRCRETPVTNLRQMAQDCASAIVGVERFVAPHTDAGFALLGAGSFGGLVAHEVGKALRRTANVQPHFLAVLHAAGPQAYVEDDDEDQEEPFSPALSGKSGSGLNEAKKVETGPPLSERPAEALFEHVQTLERGYMPNEVADNAALFEVGLPVYRNDQRALENFRYESDWALARPLLHVVAHYDGTIPLVNLGKWALETTKGYEQVELCCGSREMLRAPHLLSRVGKMLTKLVDTELKRPVDPEEAKLEALARGA